MQTATAPNAIQQEMKQAQKSLSHYLQLKDKKAEIDRDMKAEKESLEAFASKYKMHFDDNGNYHMEGGYLKFSQKTDIKTGKKFSLSAFLEQMPEYLKPAFNVGMIKKAFQTPEAAEKLKKLEVSLVEKEEFSILSK